MWDYRIHSRINIWTGKVIINWNHYKSMHAIDRIDTMFVNEKIIRIYSFCPFSVLTTKHKTNAYYVGYHDKKTWPPEIPHRRWGHGNPKSVTLSWIKQGQIACGNGVIKVKKIYLLGLILRVKGTFNGTHRSME